MTLSSCLVYSCICIVLCCYLGYAHPPRKDPVDFTVVNDSAVNQAQKTTDGLPKDVDVNFNVLGSPVRLHLKRNVKLRSAEGVYVIKRSSSGVPVIVQQRLKRYERFAEYQDPIHKAIFQLFCSQTEVNQTCDAIMEGTFRSGQKEFRMKLMDEKSMHRAKRAATSKLWVRAKDIVLGADGKSKVYGIYETEASKGTPTDYTDKGPMITGNVAAFGRSAKIVRDDVVPGGRQYNLEILALLDYGIYQRFYKSAKGRTEAERDNEAKLNIQRYFSHVFNGVDLMYKNVDDPNFSMSVGVSGMIIADSPEASPWSSPLINVVRDGRDELLVSESLNALISWSFSARNVPENDHIMLITDYDLYSIDGGSKDLRTAGYARVASVCSLDSVSIIEDHGGFQSINAAAHELGHSLGARHDGNSNQCNPSDQYIMTAHGGFETEATQTNPWQFSRCSVEYFKNYIQSLRRNCLADPIDVFDEAQFTEYLSNYPGQMYSPNEQCQDILGLESYYGWGKELGSFSDICTSMSCSIPGSSRSFRIYKAATGTSCGDKKWCQTGKCVFDERAPTRSPTCLFGDAQRRFGNNKSCKEYMLERPLRCYDSFYKDRCCETCEKLNTGVPNCEFGDKFLNCRSGGCFNSQYSKDCCSTCGLAPPPVLRTTPTTVSPPTRRPFTSRPTRRPITARPPRVPTRPPPVVTSRPRPRPTTRRPTVWVPEPVTRRPLTPSTISSNVLTEGSSSTGPGLQPSGTQGLCLRTNDKFLLVFTCSSMTNLFGENACDNQLISRYCCEKCPTEPTCVDSPTCNLQFPRDCYVQATRENCCGSCKRSETNIPGCEYGDRIRSCQRYVGGLGTAVVCGKYQKYCCGLCSAFSPDTNAAAKSAAGPPTISVGDNTAVPGVPNNVEQPSTFIARDSNGSLMIVGTGRDKGKSRNNKNKGRKGNNKRQNGNKRGKGRRGKKQNNNANSAIDLNVFNGNRLPNNFPNSGVIFASRPNQRPGLRPNEMRNFRIVISGK